MEEMRTRVCSCCKLMFRSAYVMHGMCLDCAVLLAKIGLTAVIDEATGYQKVRSKDALRKMEEAGNE